MINVAFVLIDIHCMSIEGNPNLLQFYATYTDMNISIDRPSYILVNIK